MIMIYKPNGEQLKTILDNEFFNHISAEELLEDHPEYDEQNSNWSFTVYLDKIRLCMGSSENAVLIPLDHDINVGRFKKDWYLSYCKSQGYTYTNESLPSGMDHRGDNR